MHRRSYRSANSERSSWHRPPGPRRLITQRSQVQSCPRYKRPRSDVTDNPVIEYRPPRAGDPHWLVALGLTGTVPDEPPDPMLPVTMAVSEEASASNDPQPLFDPTRRGASITGRNLNDGIRHRCRATTQH